MAVTLGKMVTLSNDLTLINQQLRGAFNRISKSYQLNITQCAIMQKLADLTPDDGQTNILTLAKALGMNNAMVSRQITTLMDQDLVAEWSDTKDRRQRQLKLTAAGEKELNDLTEIFDQNSNDDQEAVHTAVLAHIVEVIRLLNEFSVM